MQHSLLLLDFLLIDCLLFYSTHQLLPNNTLHCCCLLLPLVNYNLLPLSLELVCCQGGCHHLLCYDSCCTTTVLQCCYNLAEQHIPVTLSHCHHSMYHCIVIAQLHFTLHWPLPWPIVGCHCCHDHNHCPSPSHLTILLSGNSSWQLLLLPLHCYPFLANSIMLCMLCCCSGHWLIVAFCCFLRHSPQQHCCHHDKAVTALNRCCKLCWPATLIQPIHIVWHCYDAVAVAFATFAVLL